MRKTRLIELEKEGDKKARTALALVNDPGRLLATIQVGITLAGFLASAAAAVGLADDLGRRLTFVFGPYGETIAVILVTLIISFITLVLGELVPKRLALHRPERVALGTARPITLLAGLAKPLVWLLTSTTALVLRLFGAKQEVKAGVITEDEIRLMIREHHDLAEEEKEMIHGVFEFGDRLVQEIMTHRTDMVCVDDRLPLTEFPAIVREHCLSRYPVFHETIDDITGYISVKDYLVECGQEDASGRRVGDLQREVFAVPAVRKAADVLRDLKEKHLTMAVVVDEYGGTAGLVTVEDLLEEIVGELIDEYNEEDKPEHKNNGEIVLAGRTDLQEAAEHLGGELPDGPYETLAGFCLFHLGHIPAAGESFRWRDRIFRIDEVEGKRITRVHIKRQPAVPGTAPSE